MTKGKTQHTYYRAYMHPETEAAPAGSKDEPVYQMTIDERGRRILRQTGLTNIYDIIQASLEQSKIETIIRRATEGDPYALQQMNGQYIDVTNVPATLAEAQAFVIKAKQEFDQLPINIRRAFGMSAEQYIAMYGTSEWMYNMGITKNAAAATSTTETASTTETGGATE